MTNLPVSLENDSSVVKKTNSEDTESTWDVVEQLFHCDIYSEAILQRQKKLSVQNLDF